MRATATPAPIRNGKRRLLESCAIVAGLAALAYGGPALAQVAGTGAGVPGSGLSIPTISPPGPGPTTVNTTGAQTIINWTPTDAAATGGAIDFLPAGNSLNFIGTGNYTVLNRFVNGAGGSLSRQIALNGTITSTTGAATGTQGGNIWFYNAGGILIGATGVINVGSLVLTANNIDTDGDSGLFGPGGTIRFRGAAGTSAIAIAPGAEINATNGGNPGSSYIALVAPRIVQSGLVEVSGSAAFVAAEQADVRINNGLFDINVTVGAANGNAIVHTGTTRGPEQDPAETDQSRIYMVAIPKNDAVTMLVAGQIGYQDADAATVDNGRVVLSAGYNINGGAIAATPAAAGVGNITVADSFFRSDTIAHASGAFIGRPLQERPEPGSPVTAPPPPQIGALLVEGNGAFIGDASASLTVGANQLAGATGNLTVQSNGTGSAAGAASVNVQGGQLVAGGTLSVLAGALPDATTGNSQGGTATYTQTGGAATFLGSLLVNADALAVNAGTGTGGTATVNLLGGTTNATTILASASGTGGIGSQGSDDNPANLIPGGAGGIGQGGSAEININGTAVITANSVAAAATGQGGSGGGFSGFSGFAVPGGNGGTGIGGDATINMVAGTLNTGNLVASAAGIGGDGGNVFASSSSGPVTGIGLGGTGGTGQGGTATIDLSTAVNATGTVTSIATGRGGAGGFGNIGGNGGEALGGLAQLIVNNFNAGALAFTVNSAANGGDGGFGDDGAGGNGGAATGGTARVRLEGANARATVSATNFRTEGEGGLGGDASVGFGSNPAVGAAGGNGGNGTGGTVEVIANGGIAAVVPSGTFDAGVPLPASLGSGGTGGDGGAGANTSQSGGNGGNGGNGLGGGVHLLANGGTITTNGGAIDLITFGVAGAGGAAGNGSAGNGAAGVTGQTVGGLVRLESYAAGNPGQINFGVTRIAANGDTAGRIELLTDSGIAMTSLEAQALGNAAPTNNDTDAAPAGIFLAATGGTIATTGAMTLTTGSSVGVYAQADGIVDVGTNLAIQAGDQIDIRHEFGAGAAPTIQTGGSLTATATNSISGAPGSLLDAGTTLSLAAINIGVDALDATNIVMTSTGAASVEHAEATNNFTANVGSFRTGLNSIITGGTINISSPGAVDLGNSTAGDFVFVNGQSITFNSITAGASVGLSATGNTAGAEGISGGSIDAGGSIDLFATRVAITGTISADGSLFASGSAGPVAINLVDAGGEVFISAAGDITGTYNAQGNVRLNSGANIIAAANATGFESSSTGLPVAAGVFADAAGNVVLANSSAAGMFGVNAGGSASLNGINAGEDILVLAGTTATLTNVTAGDDLTAIATGGIIANGITTTGAGPDNQTLTYGAFSPSGPGSFQVNTSPPDLSNIVLTASAGGIGGGNMNAFDNLTLTAAGAVTTTGTLRSGLATAVDAGSISFAAIDAGSTVDLSATGTAAGAEGIRGTDITAGGDINLNGNSIAITGAVAGDASFFAIGSGENVAVNQADIAGTISIFAAGNLTGTYVSGGDIFLNSDASIDASATANGGYADSSGIATQGNLFVDAAGNVVLANSAAARMFGVNAGGSATITGGEAGEDLLVLTGTTASLTNVVAGDDVDVRATGNVTAANARATGAGADTHMLNYLPGSGFTITQGEGNVAINGSDIFLSSGGSINASALSAADDIVAIATGAITLNGATTLGLGNTAGGSNIRTQGGDTSLSGLNSFNDVFVDSTGSTSVTGTIAAGRNVTINANAVDLADLTTPGGNPVNTITAAGNLAINSASDISGGTMVAGGDLALTAGAAIAVRGAGGGSVALDGATGITADSVFSQGITTLNSDGGAIAINGLASTGAVDANADSIFIGDGGDLNFASLVTDVGNAVVRTSGDLYITSGNVAGTADLRSSGERLAVLALTAGGINLEASNGFMALTNVSATGNLNAEAAGSILIDGIVTGQNISLSSSNISIDTAARVGTAGVTQNLSVGNNNADSQTFVGGTGTPNGYHIDASELTRLYGSDIVIFGPNVADVGGGSVGSATPPDVVVDSFTITGGAPGSNLGPDGSLTIQTPGKMRVIGNVQLTGLTDDNALNLFADDALEVLLGQGTVRLTGANNAPGGQLNMASDDIIVATLAAINDVGAATTTDAIESRLAQNDGVVLDEGALFARGISANVVGGFYVQNSGTGTEFANRRGLTFGAGGLDVLTEGPSRIVINGVHLGANGQVTGLDTIQLLTIAGASAAGSTGSFDPRSTFNGCIIANTASCTVVTFDFENSFPVQDVIEDEADNSGEDGDGNSLPVPLITMRDLDPLSGEPLLDDPVTGAGNDDLWTTPTEQP